MPQALFKYLEIVPIFPQSLGVTAYLIFCFQVRAEDTDVLVHHGSSTSHPLLTMSPTVTYDSREIQQGLSERQALPALLLRLQWFCDTHYAMGSNEKSTLFDRECFLCKTNICNQFKP